MNNSVAILLVLLILLHIIVSQDSKIVDLKYFKQESCSIYLGESDADSNRYDPHTHLLYTNNTISDISGCEVRVRKNAKLRFLASFPELKTTLLCEESSLHAVVVGNGRSFDSNYGDHDLCRVESISYSTYLYPDGFLTSPYALYKFDSDAVLTRYETPERFSKVHLVFRHGKFVYTVYTKSDGMASIGRMCGNDNGDHNTFRTYRQGPLSCTTERTEHRIVLAAQYERSNLILLTSRPPVSLSGRILCSISLDHIDSLLDSGDFFYFDENGSKQVVEGYNQTCNGEMSDLSQLNEVIHGTHIILKSLTSYVTFTKYQKTWYLGADDVLDLRQDLPPLLRSSSPSPSPSNYLYQSITTDIKSPGQIDIEDGVVTIVGREAVTFLPLHICSHLQEPQRCYSIVGCSWSIDTWGCVISDRDLSFSRDHPDGIRQISRSGCQIDITTYSEFDTTSTSEEVECDTPILPHNAEFISINTTCMGSVQMSCKSGTYLESGNLNRYCLPTGGWSGIEPVCRDRLCDALDPGPSLTISSPSRQVGSLVHANCRDACETPTISDPLLCTESGKWNSSLPACARKQCSSQPSLSENTELLYKTQQCGGVMVTKCVNDTTLVSGDLLRECLPDGTWSGETPRCQVTTCGRLPPPHHGNVTSPSTAVGDVVTVTCDTCHTVSHTSTHTVSMTTECLPTGMWSSHPVCTIVTCPALEPSTGVIMKRMNNTCIGTAEFQCAPGHIVISGDLVRHCQTDGSWSGAAPTCEPEPVLEAPLPITSTEDGDRGMVALAVVGWLLFVASLIFILMVAILAKRGLLGNDRFRTTSFGQKGGDYSKYTSKLERQLTQTTTASLQRSRAGTATLPESERYNMF